MKRLFLAISLLTIIASCTKQNQNDYVCTIKEPIIKSDTIWNWSVTNVGLGNVSPQYISDYQASYNTKFVLYANGTKKAYSNCQCVNKY